MTDILTCRLPVGEAELYRAYARQRGVPISVAIREALDRQVQDALTPTD